MASNNRSISILQRRGHPFFDIGTSGKFSNIDGIDDGAGCGGAGAFSNSITFAAKFIISK